MQVRRYAEADRASVIALAPRLTEGVAGWRDRRAVRGAVLGWVTGSLTSPAADDHAVFVADDDRMVLGFVTCGEREHFTGQVDGYVGELVALGYRDEDVRFSKRVG